MYERELSKNFDSAIKTGRAIIILGARRVGKTTLIRQYLKENFKGKKILEINCDIPFEKDKLDDISKLLEITSKFDVIYIDEAQKVDEIGNKIKVLVDKYKNEKVIFITGSSSIHLQYKTSETLTGRKFLYNLYPLSIGEINNDLKSITLEEYKQYMLYGMYPEVITSKADNLKGDILSELVNGYLYKDLLDWQLVRNSEIVTKLLQALALQIGSEVSYNELAQIVGIDKETVARYVELLEQSFVIFRLQPYYSNKRKSISKLRKVYFWDLGIRNAILNNFLPIDLRNDAGHLWENFIISERIKFTQNINERHNRTFMRTYDQAEVDLIEEKDSKVFGYEIKWNMRKKEKKAPLTFSEIPNSEYMIINPINAYKLFQK